MRLVPLVLVVLVLLHGEARASVGSLADSSGTAVAWGWNDSGQTIVPSGQYLAADAGGSFNLGILSDGTLDAWGDNGSGQTAVPSGLFTAVAAGDFHCLGLSSDGTLVGWGFDAYGQATVPSGSYQAVAAGSYHSLAIRHDDTLTGWGDNLSGQTNVPSGTFTAIASGADYSLGLRTDGTLAGWGNNSFGRTSVPSGTFTAVAAAPYHGLAIDSDGGLAGWGDDSSGQASVPSGEFTAIAGGLDHSLGITVEGSLIGWGDNTYGQIDVPDGTFVQVSAGNYHSLALRARTAYDGDLLVGYAGPPTGPNGLRANLNRSISVAGDAILEAPLFLHHNPTMTVGGKLTIEPTTWLNVVDSATIITGDGIDVQSGAWLFVPANLTLTSHGPLMGGGMVEIEKNLSVGLTAASIFTGELNLWEGAALSFSDTGTITPNIVSVQTNAEIRITAGQRLLADSTFFNSGRVEALGNGNVLGGQAEIDFGDNESNGVDGLITGHDAVFRFGRGLGMDNDGAIALTSGVNDIFGDLTNQLSGAVVVTGGAQATFYDDVLNDGSIVVRQLGGVASTATFLGDYTGSGGTSGGGDILFEGDLRPGHSPAAIEFDNNVALGPGARVVIELGGTAPGSLHDTINIGGAAVLDGLLEVALIEEAPGVGTFVPNAGDSFEILTAGNLVGSFAAESLPAIPGRPGLQWLIDYDTAADRVLLTVAPYFEADFDLDGDVDGADLSLWRNGFSTGCCTATKGDGDYDKDGDVDGSDFLGWQREFGSSSGTVGAAVPEPASLALAFVMATVAAAPQRRGIRRSFR
jgi:Regulator of Chromosome Condensation (RCC1) repeat protein